MSRLDDIEAPEDGFYPVEIRIRETWINLAALKKENVIKVCDLASDLAGKE